MIICWHCSHEFVNEEKQVYVVGGKDLDPINCPNCDKLICPECGGSLHHQGNTNQEECIDCNYVYYHEKW